VRKPSFSHDDIHAGISMIARFVTARVRARAILFAVLTLLSLTAASAQETITYTYDARGRLVNVDHGATGPNAGASAAYTYDNADNRSQVVVSGGGGTTTITLSPTSLPSGTVGTAYGTTTITASGGTSPYTYAVTTGSLPTGLNLSSAGALSGTPSATGTYSFTVTATDASSHTGSQAYTVTINAAVTITVNPSSVPNGTVGASYSQTITASGGTSPYTFTKSAGTLPAGVSLTTGGVLSGTPTTANTYSFTIKATDSASHTGTRAYSVTVSPANDLTLSPASLPAGTVGTAYSSTTITASGGTSPYTFAKSSGTLPVGLSLSSGGVLSGTPTTAATYSFTVTATDHNGNHVGSKSYSVTVSPANNLTLAPATLPSGTVGTAYSQTITASGGTSPYTFTKTSGTVPAGLTLSSGGVLSGTPTTATSYSFTVQATDSIGNHIGSKSYSVTIGASGPTANPDSASTTVCGTVSTNVIANDTGFAPLTLTGIVSSTKGTASVESSTNVSYTAFGNPGTGVVTYTVTDGHGATANGTLSITISGGVCP
jgi:hypothetical protein